MYRKSPFSFRCCIREFRTLKKCLAVLIVFLCISCEENPPHPTIHFESWEGCYAFTSNWYGEAPSKKTPRVQGTLHTEVKVDIWEDNLHLDVMVSSDPGKVLQCNTVATTVMDSMLAFSFIDNWGAKGLGQLFKLDDGSYHLHTEALENTSSAAPGMLYGRKELLKTVSNTLNFYNSYAEAFYKKNAYLKAIRLTDILLKKYPDDPRALGNIGLFYLKHEAYDKAKQWMQIAVTRLENPDHKAAVYYNRGLLALEEKQPQDATLYFKISYYLRPHPAVEKQLQKLAPFDPLPEPAPKEHPFELQDFREFQQALYTPEMLTLSLDALARAYHSEPEGELNEQTISTKEHQEFITQLTYKIESIRDDSLSGIKFDFYLVQVNDQWELLEVRFSFKCHQDRGHTDWGVEYCL